MRRIVTIVVAVALCLVPTAAGASAAGEVAMPMTVSGTFVTTLDPASLTATPRGSGCLVTAEGVLAFTGDLTGSADAVTEALVRSSCDQVVVNPPGAFPDVFRSDLVLTGTLDGQAVTLAGRWVGTTAEGGAIDSVLVVRGETADGQPVHGALQVDAQVGVGGTWQGRVVVG